MKRKSKGFTLIEIIVVLMISSIVMVVAGSLILSNTSFFEKTTMADQDKLAVDSISRYVSDELLYATDVRIQISKPEGEGWNYFSMKDNRLLLNNEASFPNDYYHNRDLLFSIKGYDVYHVDLTFSFSDGSKKVYTTSNTIELLNLKYKKNKIDTSYDPFAGLTSTIDLSKNQTYKVYYRKDRYASTPDWTVAGEYERCAIKTEPGNNVKQWRTYVPGDNSSIVTFNVGDFVEYPVGSKNYYRVIVACDNTSHKPDEKGVNNWKKIDVKWDENSFYDKNDIVSYNGRFYRASVRIAPEQTVPMKNYLWDGNTGWTPGNQIVGDGFYTVKEMLDHIDELNKNFPGAGIQKPTCGND